MNPHAITEDQIKLRAFPFSVQDTTKEWLSDLPSSSITTWNDVAKLFMGKNFPEARVSNLGKEILEIKQAKNERFKKLFV